MFLNPHFVDKGGGGRPMWISERGGGGFADVNIFFFIFSSSADLYNI